jgi:P27 family predicted phage terminase small subunit
MGMPRKDEEAHALHGTVSQARSEAPPVAGGRPRINKKNLSREAVAQFRRLVKMLSERRTVTEGDSEILRLYAVLWDRHRQATESLASEGLIVEETHADSNGQPYTVRKKNMSLGIAETCEAKMVSILDRLGLTPINRKNVKPTKSDDPMGISFH